MELIICNLNNIISKHVSEKKSYDQHLYVQPRSI